MRIPSFLVEFWRKIQTGITLRLKTPQPPLHRSLFSVLEYN